MKNAETGSYEGIYEKLTAYCASDAYPFHMPGHKRRLGSVGEAFAIDITEIDGFDNLHHAEELLKDAQDRAAALYGAEQTFYLVNGSTCGILAAVSAAVKRGGKLLMARNCHKAVYHAAEIRGLQTVYLYPETVRCSSGDGQSDLVLNGAIRAEDVENALKADPQIEAVFLTSPTYDGIVSDIRKIAETAHRYGAALIVDEAHGAHFGFHPYFPENSVGCGADLVIHSLHKTLPSMTQTALLHVGRDSRVSAGKTAHYLDIYETSSPSYVLMAGMDRCMEIVQDQGEALFSAFAERLEKFYRETEGLRHVHVLKKENVLRAADGAVDFDRSRLILSVDKEAANVDSEDFSEGSCGKKIQNGADLADYLRKEHHLEMEMAAGAYCLALCSIGDDDEGFERLAGALKSLDERICAGTMSKLDERICAGTMRELEEGITDDPDETGNSDPEGASKRSSSLQIHPQQVCTIAEAVESEGTSVRLWESAGKVSQEYAYLYPPGIPLLVPGERIEEKLLQQIHDYHRMGLEVQGLQKMGQICCMKRNLSVYGRIYRNR